MFRNDDEYAESYNFGSEEETVLEEEERIIITALFQAIENGSQNVIEDLFSSYVIDINKQNFEANNGELVLQVACGFGNGSIVELLIQNNADVNLQDSNGEAAIHWAAREGHSHIVRLLYEHGADVNLQNKSGETSIHLACRFDHVDCIRQLCKCGANVNLVDAHGESVLHVACFFDLPRIVDVLGEVGIDTNLQNNDLESSLHVAAVRGHFECVKSLLETGDVNLNLLDKNGCTALHLALRRYHTEIAILLINYKPVIHSNKDSSNYKCNVEIKDVKKQTALHLACSTNQKKVVDQLCKVGCNLNVQNMFNETPLHLSIKSNNLKIIRRLCAAGCDLFIQNSSGCLPKDLIEIKPAYELEDNEEKLLKNEITRLINTLMDPIIRCKLIGMLKPVVNYYDKCLVKDLATVKSSINDCSKNNNNSSKKIYCPICYSTIDTIKRTIRCCNSSNQCVRLTDTNLPCCNSSSGVEQILSFNRSTEDQNSLNNNLISTIPKQLLKFNLKILGSCASGKTTLIETLKCGYLASWFRTTNRPNSNSSRSLNTNHQYSFNSNGLTKSNHGLSDKTVLSSISTLISSKSSLDSNSPQSAINSINSSSVLSINSDYLSSNNSSNFNLNNHVTNLNNNLNNSNLNHSNHHSNNSTHQFNSLKDRKNSAINSDICNLKALSKEFSVSDGLVHPFDCKQDLNKFFASFDLLDSKFALNHLTNISNGSSNHANHKLDCTLGINVECISVPNAGDLTFWDFCGHQNYLQIYNKFLNDQDDAFYIVCFNGCDSFDKQYTNTCYWLDLIKSVIRINRALNFEGHLKRKINVLVIATHRDLALKKNFNEINLKNLDKNIIQDLDNLNLRLSTNCLDNLNVLHRLLKQKYEQVFNLGDCIHLLDARSANTTEIKQIKQHLEHYRAKFAITLQPITHLLEEVIKKLTILRKQTYSPIISYSEFVNLIRDQINLLVEDEYIEYICLQLEKLGEIIRLKNINLDTQELIIYDVKWLTNDVIGNLLNSSYLENNGKITGHYSLEDLQNLFPDIDALDLFLILENLELCTSCESEGNFLYLFPCFIQIGRPEISWQSDELSINGKDTNGKDSINNMIDDQQQLTMFNSNYTYIGLRIQCDDNCYPKHLLVCLFPRIQILLERCFQCSTILQNDMNELKLIHWCNGLRISSNHYDLEAIISLGFLASSLEFDSIEIKVRSSKENRKDCFRLFYLLTNLIEQFINSSFPNLPLQRSYYSPFELNCKRKFLYRYSTEELANCLFKNILTSSETNENQINKQDDRSNAKNRKRINIFKEQIKNNESDLNESLADIIACGIDDLDQIDFKSDNFLVNTIKEFFESFLINNNVKSNWNAEQDHHTQTESNEELSAGEKEDDFKPILITNFKVHDLDVLTRQSLCKLFDPPDQFGFDWCMLSIKLNLTEKLPILDSKRKPFTSPTWRLLEEFSKEPNCTLEHLLTKLIELNRKNAIELLFKSLPLIKIFPIKSSKFKPLLAYDSFQSNEFA